MGMGRLNDDGAMERGQFVSNLSGLTIKINKFGNPKGRHRVDVGNGNVVEAFTHDEYGLALDPKVWASNKDCCYGRGFIWKRTTRKETVQGPDNRVFEREVPHQEMHPCPCALSRYQKMRKKVEDRLTKATSRGEDPARELERIHKEFGHDIRIESKPQGEEESKLVTPP